MAFSGKRICNLAEDAAAADDPGEALRTVRALRSELDEFERQQVARALTLGESFGAVARALDVSRQSAHRRFRDLAPAGGPDARAALPPTPETRLAVEYARREAGDLGAPAVGGEHLLLGIVRNGDPRAAARLEDAGVTLDGARSAAARVGNGDGPEAARADARAALAAALRAARRDGAHVLGVEHLLAGLLQDPGGRATRVAVALGVDVGALAGTLRSD